MGHCSSYEEVQAVDTTFAMEVAAIAEFHIVRDWSEFYECRTTCFNMAATCGVEIQDSPTSSGCSTTKMKTDNPYQTDIYVKYLQISATYLWQYCTLSVVGLSVSAPYLHDVRR